MPDWEYAELFAFHGDGELDPPSLTLVLPDSSVEPLAKEKLKKLKSIGAFELVMVEVLNDLGRQGWEVTAVETDHITYSTRTYDAALCSGWWKRYFWLKRQR